MSRISVPRIAGIQPCECTAGITVPTQSLRSSMQTRSVSGHPNDDNSGSVVHSPPPACCPAINFPPPAGTFIPRCQCSENYGLLQCICFSIRNSQHCPRKENHCPNYPTNVQQPPAFLHRGNSARLCQVRRCLALIQKHSRDLIVIRSESIVTAKKSIVPTIP